MLHPGMCSATWSLSSTWVGCPGLAATLHVVASTPGVPYVEMPPGQLSAPLLATPIRFANGAVHVPEGPGLGADPDPEVFRRHAYTREAARPFYLT